MCVCVRVRLWGFRRILPQHQIQDQEVIQKLKVPLYVKMIWKMKAHKLKKYFYYYQTEYLAFKSAHG